MGLTMEIGDIQQASAEKKCESDAGTDSDGDSVSDVNQAWASVMTSILKVKSPKKKSIVLSKAKKLSSLSAGKKGNSADEEVSSLVNLTQKQYWVSKGRKKPSVLEKDRERTLQKFAVKGVVQLFNAVSMYQKKIKGDAKEVDSSQRKQETNQKSCQKGTYSNVHNQMTGNSEIKEEEGRSETWAVLNEDFITRGKLKDWNKEAVV